MGRAGRHEIGESLGCPPFPFGQDEAGRRTLRKFYAELRLWNDELERESHRDYQEAWAERDKGEHAAT